MEGPPYSLLSVGRLGPTDLGGLASLCGWGFATLEYLIDKTVLLCLN